MDKLQKSHAVPTELQHVEDVHNGFLKIKKYTLTHQRFDGAMTEPLEREVMLPPSEAVAVLLVDSQRREFVFVEQFRMGPFAMEGEGRRLLEVVAGYHEVNESFAVSACREVFEETGISIDTVQPILSYWVSPGASGERMNLFWAEVDASQAKAFAGSADEAEDIRVCRFGFDETYDLVAQGAFDNAMTLLCLQWFQLNKI